MRPLAASPTLAVRQRLRQDDGTGGELGGQRIGGLVKALACGAVLVRDGAAEAGVRWTRRPKAGAVIERWPLQRNGAAGVN